MQKGYNSDLIIRGKKYHIQTEDWGRENPYIVSRIFLDGAVVKTVKLPYERAVELFIAATSESSYSQFDTEVRTDQILEALRKQHFRVIDELMSGNY